jgi:beta-lactamase superfamily II metal-dependent hydrolase
LHVIDVGTGLALLFEGPSFTMLCDAGNQDDLADGPSNRVVSYIRAVRPGVTVIDHVVLSHPVKDYLELRGCSSVLLRLVLTGITAGPSPVVD